MIIQNNESIVRLEDIMQIPGSAADLFAAFFG